MFGTGSTFETTNNVFVPSDSFEDTRLATPEEIAAVRQPATPVSAPFGAQPSTVESFLR
jgi:hypothetical protein